MTQILQSFIGGRWLGTQAAQALNSAINGKPVYSTHAEAIDFGEAVFLAVPYGAMPQIGRDFGAQLAGKVVLDAGNAVESRDGAAIAAEAEQNGIGMTSQKYLPGARLVRAFNTLGYTILEREANRAEPRLAIPIAGDDAAALQVAAALVRDAGFEPVVVGKLADARRFQRGAPGYGQVVSAAELRKTLSLAPWPTSWHRRRAVPSSS